MTTQLYTVAQGPLLSLPAGSTKLLDIPPGTIVSTDGQMQKHLYKSQYVDWLLVTCVTSSKVYVGWMYAGYLDPCVQEFTPGVVAILSATPNPVDPAQVYVRNGVDQWNGCGELCAAFVLNKDLNTVLDTWQSPPASASAARIKYIYQLVFGKGRAPGTSPEDLISIFEAFNIYDTELLEVELHDAIIGRAVLSPARLGRLLDKGVGVIQSVHIEGGKGRLKPSGILHWVVPVHVIPDGPGFGRVRIYNPYPDTYEWYDWETFAASARAPYGLAVRQ